MVSQLARWQPGSVHKIKRTAIVTMAELGFLRYDQGPRREAMLVINKVISGRELKGMDLEQAIKVAEDLMK